MVQLWRVVRNCLAFLFLVLFERYSVGCITSLGVCMIDVDLCRAYILVRQEVLNGVDVRAKFQLQRGICVTEAVAVKPEINGRQIKAVRNLKR